MFQSPLIFFFNCEFFVYQVCNSLKILYKLAWCSLSDINKQVTPLASLLFSTYVPMFFFLPLVPFVQEKLRTCHGHFFFPFVVIVGKYPIDFQFIQSPQYFEFISVRKLVTTFLIFESVRSETLICICPSFFLFFLKKETWAYTDQVSDLTDQKIREVTNFCY